MSGLGKSGDKKNAWLTSDSIAPLLWSKQDFLCFCLLFPLMLFIPNQDNVTLLLPVGDQLLYSQTLQNLSNLVSLGVIKFAGCGKIALFNNLISLSSSKVNYFIV